LGRTPTTAGLLGREDAALVGLADAREAVAAVGGGAVEGWELRDVGAVHLHGRADKAVSAGESDISTSSAVDIVVLVRYAVEKGAALDFPS
jgi:hypothetical protein